MKKSFWLALLLGLSIAPAYAEDMRDNLVNLQVEVSRSLANDVLNASMFIEDNDANPTVLAERVNSQLNAAMAIAKGYKTVKVSTGSIQTYPLYADRLKSMGSDKIKLVGWRTRASLALESKDFAAAQKLLGELQGRLQIENVGFSVSTELRSKQENELIGQAFAAFRERAQLVQQGLNGKGWKVVNVTLANTGNEARPVMAYRAKALMADAAAPELAAGESEIRLQVNGMIQVTP